MTATEYSAIHVLAVGSTDELAPALEALAAIDGIELMPGAGTVEAARRTLAETQADCLVLCVGDSGDDKLYDVAALQEHTNAPIVLLAVEAGERLMALALGLGAHDVVATSHEAEHFAFVVRKAVSFERRRKELSRYKRALAGQVVTFYSSKGGVGCTSLAINIAASIARSGRRVLVLDLDLASGDVALSLGVQPRHTLLDLFLTAGELDPATILSFITTHSSGIDLLIAPLGIDDAVLVAEQRVSALLAIARRMYDVVIIDTSCELTEHVVTAIDRSDRLVLVSATDAAALRATKAMMQMLGNVGFDERKFVHVLNRADARVDIELRDLPELLRARPLAVPSTRAMPSSLNRGVPLVLLDERNPASRAIVELAAALAPLTQNEALGARLAGRVRMVRAKVRTARPRERLRPTR